MAESERVRLIRSVADWFGAPDQVDYYAQEAPAGPTPLETKCVRDLPHEAHRIVDLGCGAGRASMPLARAGSHVVGTDISFELLRAARAHAARSRVNVALLGTDPLRLPFRAASFDVAVAFKLYGYIPGRATRLDYLSEIARVLRTGGSLLLTSHVVTDRATALGSLHADADAEHVRAVAAFPGLDPLDTFSAGQGFVHWFTQESLLDELSRSPFTVQGMWAEDSGLQVAVHLRVKRSMVT